MFPEDQYIAISALQHWLYCPRQCALIHVEQAWAENRFTAEGLVMHKKAHEGPDETRTGVRITRGMPVASQGLGLAGQCDVVEFHPERGDMKFEISDLKNNADYELGANLKSMRSVMPVEYKRGKPKAHRADEVQLCAQGICLEEMLGIPVQRGSLYYGEKRRRTDVVFDAELRELVRTTVTEIRQCLDSGITPTAEYQPRRCDACSLIDICQPHAMRLKNGAAAWFTANLKSQISNFKSPPP